jgi:hypothetical protein
MLEPAERNVGLTVNEYETLLMRHDLVDVLRNPLHFAKVKGLSLIDHPRQIPGKTLSYAKYDGVRVLNSLMEALRLDQSSLERLFGKIMAFPARRFIRSRRVSFFAAQEPAQLLPVSFAAPIRARSSYSGSQPKAKSAGSPSPSSNCQADGR